MSSNLADTLESEPIAHKLDQSASTFESASVGTTHDAADTLLRTCSGVLHPNPTLETDRAPMLRCSIAESIDLSCGSPSRDFQRSVSRGDRQLVEPSLFRSA